MCQFCESVLLHNHTARGSNLRLRDTTNSVEELIDTVYAMGHKGLALTEHESICSHVKGIKYVEKMKKDGKLPKDFKLILGNEIYLVDSLEEVRDNYQGGGVTKFPHFLILAKDEIGHEQIRKMSSQAWKNSFMTGIMLRTPTEKKYLASVVAENPNHLIASTACFVKGTKVKTSTGLKSIEDVSTEDFVLTHTGEWKKVISPTSRPYKGKLKTIHSKGSSLPITSTENHKFFVVPHRTSKTCRVTDLKINKKYYELLSKGETENSKKQSYKRNAEMTSPVWKEAKNLSANDSLLIPIEQKIEDLKYYDLSSFHKKKSKIKLPNKIEITPELMEILGLYAAEGSKNTYSKNAIIFTIDSRKKKLIDKIVNFFANTLKVTTLIIPKKNNLAFDLTINSIEVYALFDEWFGSGAKNKNVPEFIKYLPTEMQKYFIKGLFLGDGHEKIDSQKSPRKNRNNISFCTISKQLIDDVSHIFHRMWINPCVSVIPQKTDKNGVHHQEAYSCEISGEIAIKLFNFIWKDQQLIIEMKDRRTKDIPFNWNDQYYMKHNITKIETSNWDKEVYCLSVEDNHSFVAEGVIVHNCLGSEICIRLLEMKEALENNNKIKAKEAYNKGCQFIEWCMDVFGKEDFYLELQPAYSEEQIYCNKELLKLSEKYDLKYIVTTDSHYYRPEDRVVHKAFLNSKEGEREVDAFYEATFVQNLEEIQERLDYLDHDIVKTALLNTMEIGNKIKEYTILKSPVIPKIKLPDFQISGFFEPVYDKYEYIGKMAHSSNEQDRYIVKLLEDGIKKYIPYKTYTKDRMHELAFRLDSELKELWLISETLNQSMPSYYVTIQKIVDLIWDDECGDSFVGVSRGSAAGFLICYLLGITQINPLEFEIELPEWRHIHHSRPD